MSVVDTIMSAIANGLVNGISTLLNTIVNGILSGVQAVLSGIEGIIGIPMGFWSTNISGDGLSIPIIFTVILGIAVFIALFFIEAEGMETEVASGFEELENL